MKLFLLLLAIYSLIFYQSYKNEKLKGSFLDTKESMQIERNNKPIDAGKDYQNAVLLLKGDNTIYKSADRKQSLLRRLSFY